MPGFQPFFSFFASFCIIKIATSSIRVNQVQKIFKLESIVTSIAGSHAHCVVFKATTPSHSVAGNVQKVIALMKSHNPALCAGAAAAAAAARKCGSGGGRAPPRRQSSSSSIITSSSSSESDLMDLLLQLQDEFGHMSL